MLLVFGYFIGNTLPITENKIQPDDGVITSNTGEGEASTEKKIVGNVIFEVPQFAKFKGSDVASVNLVEFGDYQCPFCKRFFDQTEPQIMNDYVNTGKTKFYFLDFAIVGQDSFTLAQGAWCADDQGKYFEYHDYVYSNQGQENSGWGTPDKVKSFATNIGLDAEEFSSCLDSKKYESRVQALTQFAVKLGVTGTPTMFIGDSERGYTKITGAQPYSVFKQIIDKYLE